MIRPVLKPGCVICEIGVQRGGHFRRMLHVNPSLAVAIDPWDASYRGKVPSDPQEYSERYYQEFKTAMSDKPFVRIYRGYSWDVAKEFDDEFFDWVYIDGDHRYEAVKRDINDWYPKVKTGGYLTGHDYWKRMLRTGDGPVPFGVIEAVDEFVKERGITTFFRHPRSVWGLVK